MLRARVLALLHQNLRQSSPWPTLAVVQQARSWANAAAGSIAPTAPLPEISAPEHADAPAIPPGDIASAPLLPPGPEQPALPAPADPGRDVRSQLLSAALKHVKDLGWTHAALVAGARYLGLSPAVAGIVHHAESALVEHFVACSNKAAIKALEDMQPQLAGMRLSQKIHAAVKLRLQQNIPHLDSWPQALAVLARPSNSPRALQLLYELVDGIWYAVGDRSTDSSWFTKRALLAGIYTSTELYMLTDYSPGYQDTWDALDRRIQDALWLGKAAGQAGGAVQSVLNSLANAGSSLLGTVAPQYKAQAPAGPKYAAPGPTLETTGGSMTFGGSGSAPSSSSSVTLDTAGGSLTFGSGDTATAGSVGSGDWSSSVMGTATADLNTSGGSMTFGSTPPP